MSCLCIFMILSYAHGYCLKALLRVTNCVLRNIELNNAQYSSRYCAILSLTMCGAEMRIAPPCQLCTTMSLCLSQQYGRKNRCVVLRAGLIVCENKNGAPCYDAPLLKMNNCDSICGQCCLAYFLLHASLCDSTLDWNR